MPPQRPAVEKWNRGELEDKFHSLNEQNWELKKQKNTLEKELKIVNGRIHSSILSRRDANNNSGLQDRCEELERSNRLLSQKLQSMKHQLLVYTRPQAQNTTLNFLTARRGVTGRPQSVATSHPAPKSGHRRGPTGGNGFEREDATNQDRLPSVPRMDEMATGRFTVSTARQSRAERHPENGTALEDKTEWVRLHREIREKSDRIQELEFRLGKAEGKLGNIRVEYDKLVEEVERHRQELRAAQESARSLREDSQKSNETSHRSVQIAEKELSILREENQVLRNANERLIARSLEHDSSSVGSVEEMSRLKAHVQELEHRADAALAEKRIFETRVKDLEAEKDRLSSKYRRLRERVQELRTMPVPASQVVPSNPRSTRHPEEDDESSEGSEKPAKRSKQAPKAPKEAGPNGTVLDRLYEDIVSIMDSHMSRSASSDSLGLPQANDSAGKRWQRLYEEVYSELEKVRNMLVLQHNINQEQQKEINLLNDTREQLKLEYERRLNGFVKELDKRAKQIEILENQLRSIAEGKLDIGSTSSPSADEILSRITTSEQSQTEMTLHLTKLTMADIGLQLTQSARPVVFLYVDFFDFESQTTPPIQGPEAVFDYGTVYDVVVSNLFVHYLETDFLTVELFEATGASYAQLGTGQISLKGLLTSGSPARIQGTLPLLSAAGSQQSVATLEYRMDVPFDLQKALAAQKRRMIASSYLPVTPEDASQYNEVVVQVHRCSGLDSLSPGNRPPSTYVAYQIYDMPVHMGQAVKDNANPAYNDQRSWTVAIGSALHSYLKNEELVVYVMNDRPRDLRLPEGTADNASALGSVTIPLFPLARNQRIQGTFPLMDASGHLSKGSIDLSIHWKFAYTFDDSHLEVDAPIKVATEPKGMYAAARKDAQVEPPARKLILAPETKTTLVHVKKEEVVKEEAPKPVEVPTPTALLEPVKEPERPKPVIRELVEEVEVKKPPEPATKVVFAAASNSESEMSLSPPSSAERHDAGHAARRRVQPHPTRESETSSKESSLETAVELAHEPPTSVKETLLSEEELQRRLHDVGQRRAEVAVEKQGVDAGELERKLKETIEKQPSIAQEEPPKPKPRAVVREYDPDVDFVPQQPMPTVESPPSDSGGSGGTYTASEPSGLWNLEDASAKPQVESPVEPPKPAVRHLAPLQGPPRAAPLPSIPPQVVQQPEEEKPEIEESRPSLLGELPTVEQQRPVPARRQGKGIEFTEPLHTSIPPSETSSYADSASEGSGSSRQHSHRRQFVVPPLPDHASGHSLLRQPATAAEPPSDEEETPRGASVFLRIGRLYVIDGSTLLRHEYDNLEVFVEWNFLDFASEICETPENVPLPRSPHEFSQFSTERVYELNGRRIALLRQWMELNTKLAFTLVSDPGDEGECDDLGVAQLDLDDVIHAAHHRVTFRDVDAEPLAQMDIEISYSDELRQIFMRPEEE